MKMKGTYKLAGFEDIDKSRCAVLAMSGKIDADLALNEDALGAGMAIKIENGDYTGNTFLDSSLGLARKTEMDLQIDMAMNNPQLGQEMKISSKQRIVTEITKVEDL